MKEVFIASAVRTPMGSFGSALAPKTAVELGSTAIQGALKKAGVSADQIQEVFFGNVCQANLGQNPARQAALGAGIPNTVPSTTVNKVCASGMKSMMFGAMQIMTGMADLVMTGGTESMSNVPYYVPKARFGYKYGHNKLVDGLARDGLDDAYEHGPMGKYADNTAEKHSISREEQDEFAINSYKRAAQATEKGWFKNEIVPVEIPQRKGDPISVDEDEEYKNVKYDKVSKLKPAFSKEGSVTAANASTINDGASALVLASEEKVKELGLTPIAKIVSFGDAAQEPEWFTTAPTKAAPIALERASLKKEDIDLFEINEAFAVVAMAYNKILGLDPQKVNVHGGGVALGHPLGCSGARIATTLIHALHTHDGRYGQASICNGGGGASSLIVERV